MEKLKQLPFHWQLLVLVGAAALVYYGFYSFVTSGIYTDAAAVREQAESLHQRNEQARIATQHIEEFRQLYAAKISQYEELKVLLPEQREITNVLQGLQDTARESNLTMLRFSPRDDVPYTPPAAASVPGQPTAAAPPAPAPGAPAPAPPAPAVASASFITAKPVEVEISSNFNNLRAFYERVARLPRIVSITDFQIAQLPKQQGDKTLKSQFLLTAYYATPESAKQQLAPKPAAPAPPAK
jgi:type IV pilus assembly protein PilO